MKIKRTQRTVPVSISGESSKKIICVSRNLKHHQV